MNNNIFDKFSLELRKTLKKYPQKKSWDLVKFLFHGSKNTSPEEIYSTEYGLDNRFSRDGMYGNGIYFANNSCYSSTYAHHCNETIEGKSEQVKKMFVCFVVVGEYVKLQPTKITIPPLKVDHPRHVNVDG